MQVQANVKLQSVQATFDPAEVLALYEEIGNLPTGYGYSISNLWNLQECLRAWVDDARRAVYNTEAKR